MNPSTGESSESKDTASEPKKLSSKYSLLCEWFKKTPGKHLWLFPDYSKPWKNWCIVVAGFTGAIAAVITFILLLFYELLFHKPISADLSKILFILWTVLPPLWLWAEYWFLWRSEPDTKDAGVLERFKYAQEVGVKVWLAFATVLGANFFANIPIKSQSPPNVSTKQSAVQPAVKPVTPVAIPASSTTKTKDKSANDAD